jgi:hypothetical protein
MKTTTAMALFAACALIQVGSAADMYLVNLRGTCRIAGDPKPATVPLNTASILEHHGSIMTPPIAGEDLRLVYRVDEDRISIVDSNGVTLCDYLIFANATGGSNSVDSLRERFVFLYAEASSIAIGSGLLSEKIGRRGDGSIQRHAIKGTVQFTQPGTEETGPEICSANFTTGKKVTFGTGEPTITPSDGSRAEPAPEEPSTPRTAKPPLPGPR